MIPEVREISKRLFDIVGASIGLLALLPLMAGLCLLVRRQHGRPIFFRQRRPGLDGQPFDLIKFRTMNNNRDSCGNLLPDVERLATTGRFMRSTSLDELPELWNVLRGNMSLVGPRPLLVEYMPLYSTEQARRHEVRPGITGWAQVNGRNAISWDEKFKLDVWYVDNQSFMLDLKILWLTLWRVLRRDGISAEGAATMPKFTGSARANDLN
jgi:lipopolysaccharide/colanic/teichoic acid biosynthesis glycosyltransferase